MMLRFFK
jgi:broad specificity phosphatase PhoE